MRSLHAALSFAVLFFALVRPTFSQQATFRHIDQVQDLAHYENLEDWLGRAGWLRDQIRVSQGLWPEPEKTPLHPKFSESTSFDGYSVQGVMLETLPGFYLAGTLYRPEGNGPFPAVLSPHGHWSAGRFEHTDLASVPGRAIHLAKSGFAVLAYSMIGYNEFQDLFPHRFFDPAHQLWGFSAAGLQTWNSLRALDFVSDLPFVDPDRIGMTGASGGGTQTFILTAIDERIRAAAPVNMISAHFQGGCVCENAPALRLDANNVEIGALTAPRALLMISTSGDWTADTPEIEYPAVREIYRLFGAEDHVSNVHMNYQHNYNKDSRAAMYAWFGKWLAGKDVMEPEGPLTIPDTGLMRAPAPDTIISVDALFEAYRSAEIMRLRERAPTSWSSLDAYRAGYATPLQHALFAGPSTVEPALEIYTPAERTAATDAQLIVHGNDPAERERAAELARSLSQEGILAALVDPFSQVPDSSPPDSINYWTTYNPSVSALRIQVVRDAVHALGQRSDVKEIDLHGMGAAGPLAMLARSQSPHVRSTYADFNGVAFDADADFLANLDIPLIRKAGDFHTAAALIFPAPLTIENLPDGDLKRWIGNLYAAFDAGDRLTILP